MDWTPFHPRTVRSSGPGSSGRPVVRFEATRLFSGVLRSGLPQWGFGTSEVTRRGFGGLSVAVKVTKLSRTFRGLHGMSRKMKKQMEPPMNLITKIMNTP